MSIEQQENRITKINYNPLAKTVIPMLVGALMNNVDNISGVQQVFSRHFYSALGAGAGWAVAESEIKPGEFTDTPFPFKRGVKALLTRGLGLSAILQVPLLLEGKPELGVYIPFVVGAVGGHAIHLGAKALYESNLTAPIYRLLRIQDRRLIVTNNPS